MGSQVTVLILNAGSNLRKAFYTQDATFVELPLGELAWRDLKRYDILVVPSWSDQDLLNDYRHKLSKFIRQGGVLVQFGCHSVRWFSFIDWVDAQSESITPAAEALDSLFAGVNLRYLQWHPEFVAHGFFRAKHEEARVLARDNEGQPVIVAINHGRGLGLFLTLDPDFHLVTGSFINTDKDERIAQAVALLKNSMNWATEQFLARNGSARRVWRRIRAFFSFVTLAPLTYGVLFVLLLGAGGYALVLDPAARKSPITILSTAISVMGLAITLLQLIRQRRVRSA